MTHLYILKAIIIPFIHLKYNNPILHLTLLKMISILIYTNGKALLTLLMLWCSPTF